MWDSDEFMNDSCLGVVEIDIAEDVAKVPGGRIYKTWYLQVRTPPGSLCAPVHTRASTCVHASSRPQDTATHGRPGGYTHAADVCSGSRAVKAAAEGQAGQAHGVLGGRFDTLECVRRMCPRTRRPSTRQTPTSPCRSSGCPSTSHSDRHFLPCDGEASVDEHSSARSCDSSRLMPSSLSADSGSAYCLHNGLEKCALLQHLISCGPR